MGRGQTPPAPVILSLPLLMVTALPDHRTAMAGGIDLVLAKPFTSSTLLAAVEELGGRTQTVPA